MYKENARVSNAHPGSSYSDKCLTKKILKGRKHFLFFKPWHHSTALGLYGKALQHGVIEGSRFKGTLGGLWSKLLLNAGSAMRSEHFKAFSLAMNQPSIPFKKNKPHQKVRTADSPQHLE